MFYTVDVSKVVSELHEVLINNQVPIASLDKILEELKEDVGINTIIQKNN